MPIRSADRLLVRGRDGRSARRRKLTFPEPKGRRFSSCLFPGLKAGASTVVPLGRDRFAKGPGHSVGALVVDDHAGLFHPVRDALIAGEEEQPQILPLRDAKHQDDIQYWGVQRGCGGGLIL
jgi:hypothetical protein